MRLVYRLLILRNALLCWPIFYKIRVDQGQVILPRHGIGCEFHVLGGGVFDTPESYKTIEERLRSDDEADCTLSGQSSARF